MILAILLRINYRFLIIIGYIIGSIGSKRSTYIVHTNSYLYIRKITIIVSTQYPIFFTSILFSLFKLTFAIKMEVESTQKKILCCVSHKKFFSNTFQCTKNAFVFFENQQAPSFSATTKSETCSNRQSPSIIVVKNPQNCLNTLHFTTVIQKLPNFHCSTEVFF